VLRYYGHFEGDQQTYRLPGEVDNTRANKDCLLLFERAAVGAGRVGEDDLRAIDKEVLVLIDDAVAEAKQAPQPTPDDLLTDVYVSY